MEQLLVALRYYATGSFYITAGDFGRMHKPTCGRIIRRVAQSICEQQRNYIKFPDTPESVAQRKQG